jgi:hypothetical protein
MSDFAAAVAAFAATFGMAVEFVHVPAAAAAATTAEATEMIAEMFADAAAEMAAAPWLAGAAAAPSYTAAAPPGHGT